ncbi:MAG: transporter [bacterium]
MKKFAVFVVLLGSIFLGRDENNPFNLAPNSVLACDYCLLTQGLSPLETTHGFGFRVDGRYTVLNTMFSGTGQVENHDNEKESHFTTQLTGFYNLSERFTLIGVLPVSRRKISLDVEEGHGHADGEEPPGHEEEEGGHSDALVHSHSAPGAVFSVGDLNLLGRYTFLRKHKFRQSTLLALQAGVKIPTGSTRELDDAGEFLDAHIQPGTGSWNFLLGLSFNFVKNRFGLSSNVLYSLNSTGEAGDDDYRFGNSLNADITAKYPIISGKRNLFLALGLSGEVRGREEIDGQTIANTGGEVFYLAPGVQMMLSRRLIVEASFLYPFYHNLNGEEQLGEDSRTSFGVNYLF